MCLPLPPNLSPWVAGLVIENEQGAAQDVEDDGGEADDDDDDDDDADADADSDADANDMSGDEDDPCIRKQTYNWRQDHHEKGEGGTEASQYRWQPKPKLVRKISSSSSDQMAIQWFSKIYPIGQI